MVMISERIPLIVDQPMDVPFAPPSYEHCGQNTGVVQYDNTCVAIGLKTELISTMHVNGK